MSPAGDLAELERARAALAHQGDHARLIDPDRVLAHATRRAKRRVELVDRASDVLSAFPERGGVGPCTHQLASRDLTRPLQRRAEGVLINARAIPGGGAHFARGLETSRVTAPSCHDLVAPPVALLPSIIEVPSPQGPITLIEPNDVLDAAK